MYFRFSGEYRGGRIEQIFGKRQFNECGNSVGFFSFTIEDRIFIT